MDNPTSAYGLLDPGGDQSLNFTLHGLLDRMEAAVTAGNFSAAYARLNQLDTASRTADRLDQARVRLRCALAAWQMLDPTSAYQQLETALELLGTGAPRSSVYAHPYAVANWLLGLLNMTPTDPALTAVTAWQNSLQAFEYLSTEPGLTAAEQGWYADRRVEMLEAIKAALDGTPAAMPLQQVTLLPASPAQIPVYELVSIAIYGTPGLPPGPTRLMILQSFQDGFIIGDLMYHLFSLRGPTSLLDLNPVGQYCALRVAGDWMNWVGIERGDYVLLHFQEAVADGDIVAVEIFNVNSNAMVYQLRKDKDAILLKPQSTNPVHQILEFSADGGTRYHIYSTVLGVFKPSGSSAQAPQEEQGPAEEETIVPQAPVEEPIPVEDFLQTFRVFSAIPAGGPRMAPTFTGRHVELDRFIIDGQPYTIKSLRANGKRINPRSGNLIVLKVSGDSMNDPARANIQDGDYVLLRRQDTAENGDIIAAEIRGEDALATLKRYEVRSTDRVALVPESTNPEHQEQEFSRPRSGKSPTEPPFYIQGVALAVFKPYP